MMHRLSGFADLAEIILGAKAVGKTELCKRILPETFQEKREEEEYQSTVAVSFYTVPLENFAGVDKYILYNDKSEIKAIDTAGQEDVEDDSTFVKRWLPTANMGVVYVISAIDKDSIDEIRTYNRVFNQELRHFEKAIPNKCIYVSKCQKPKSFVKLDDVINGFYSSIEEILLLCDEVKATSLIVGDSKGINPKEKIKPVFYLVKNLDTLYEKPFKVKATTPFTINVLNKIYQNLQKQTMYNAKTVDVSLINKYKELKIY